MPEFDDAVYECDKDGFMVPGTKDGKFRVTCLRGATYAPAMSVDWPTCVPMSDQSCEDYTAPSGYVKTTPDLLRYSVGDSVVIRCEDSSQLVGDEYTVSFICGDNGDGTFGWLGSGSVPQCRDPAYCSWDAVPEPSSESGLRPSYRSQVGKP